MKLTRDYVVHSQSGIAHCFIGPQNACGNLLYNSPQLRPISRRLALRLARQGRFCQRCQCAIDRDDYIIALVEMAREVTGDRS